MAQENWLDMLPPVVREAVHARMILRRIPAGSMVQGAGERAAGMYQLAEGYLKLLGLNADGRQVLIVVYQPGNCFGESALIAKRSFHHSTLALTDVTVRFLPEADFWHLYHTHVEIPDGLCRKLASRTSLLFELREWRSTMRLRPLIGQCFRRLAEQCGIQRPDGSTAIPLPLVQNDFAEFLEVTRQAVQREVGALKSTDVVSQTRSEWIIQDMGRLG